MYYNKPYYVAPASKGQKPYLLLLETMRRTGRVGLARVVISTRQHLSALVPGEHGLVLELLRWADEVRDTAGLPLPDEKETKITERELKMAEQLVSDLEDEWKPDAFHDEFREKLEQVVQEKVKAGEGEHIMKPLEGEEVKTGADIIDLTELLRRSLRKGGAAEAQDKPKPATARRKAANDEDEAPRTRRAAASKSSGRATASVKPKPRKKAA